MVGSLCRKIYQFVLIALQYDLTISTDLLVSYASNFQSTECLLSESRSLKFWVLAFIDRAFYDLITKLRLDLVTESVFTDYAS